jgi:hypothetical protein
MKKDRELVPIRQERNMIWTARDPHALHVELTLGINSLTRRLNRQRDVDSSLYRNTMLILVSGGDYSATECGNRRMRRPGCLRVWGQLGGALSARHSYVHMRFCPIGSDVWRTAASSSHCHGCNTRLQCTDSDIRQHGYQR